MIMKRKGFVAFATIALAASLLIATADAQPYGPGAGGPGPRGNGPGMMGQGMMMGPAIMHRRGFNRMCSPGAAGFTQWRIERIEQAIKPTDAQRAKLDEYKAASAKAAEAMRTACPTEVPTTIVGRMVAMEKRFDAMSAAVKTVRPALEAFYATLSDEQKARIDSNPRGERSWRHRW
jgi:hypothetical protein